MIGTARDFYEKVAALGREGQAFAVATVVGRRAPVSAHLGDRAIVYPDGRMEGFVGGACSREIVRKQALDVLGARQARLVSIRTDPTGASTTNSEHVVVPMTCVSEGAVDVYIEPFVRARRLVVVGATPVAESLARTAIGLDYDVVRVVDARDQGDVQPSSPAPGITVVALESLEEVVRTGGGEVAAVVASQGHYDAEGLQAILRSRASGSDVRYVGLVASRKRGDEIRKRLVQDGVEGVEAVRYPAGLDLGARTPSEVALSILAEILQVEKSALPQVERSALTSVPLGRDGGNREGRRSPPATAIDPVCGMEVEVATARHTAEIDGQIYYFCCPHCRTRFVKEPQPFLSDSR